MELKDVVLSTLAELEEVMPPLNEQEDADITQIKTPEVKIPEVTPQEVETSNHHIESELLYLKSIRERLLVLFEGFQAPNNSNLEAKIDMTLNFLEYTLATIDNRVEKLEKGFI